MLDPGMRIAALIIYALAFFSFTGGNVFYDSMLIDVTVRRRMDYISALGFGIGYIGSVFPFVGILAMMYLLGEGEQGYRLTFLVTAFWWALWSLPLLLKRQNSNAPPPAGDTQSAIGIASWRRTIRAIWGNRNLRFFLLAYFLYIDGVDTLIVMSVPYGKEVGLGTTEMIAVILGIQIVAFPCSMLYGVLASRFGTKRMIGVGIAGYGFTVLIAALMPFIASRGLKSALFLLLALIVAANQGGIQALSRSCFGRLIPPERSAEYFGFYNIFGKFAAVLGPALVGISGRLFGGGQYGMLSLLLLFIGGGWMLSRTKID
jgi:UMF1 family MFS transporter